MELTQKRIIRSKIAFVFVVFGKYNNKIALFCPKSCDFLAYIKKKQYLCSGLVVKISKN